MEEGVPEAEDLLRPKEPQKDKEEEEEEEEKLEANGGVLNNLISNFMGSTTTSRDSKSGENIQIFESEDDIKDEDEEHKEEANLEANGGVLNNLISNFVGSTRTSVDCKSGENKTSMDDKPGENECEDEDEKKSLSSGSRIIEKIMSHIREDAVPTTEEASILIHSVVD